MMVEILTQALTSSQQCSLGIEYISTGKRCCHTNSDSVSHKTNENLKVTENKFFTFSSISTLSPFKYKELEIHINEVNATLKPAYKLPK